MQIEAIDPIQNQSWEAFIHNHTDATPFHTSAWAKVLRDTYDFQPRYLIAKRDNGKIEAGTPLFEVGSQRLVGVPFSDYCPPLIPDSAAGRALVEHLKLDATTEDRALEFRGAAGLDLEQEGFSKFEGFLQHIIMLDADLPEIESRFRKSVGRSIRKARRAGLTVRAGESLDDMKSFYELNITTRRRHGLIPQPWRFFENIYRHMICGGSGLLLICEDGDQVVASDLILGHGTKLISKFNASDPNFLQVSPNHLLQMATIELAVADGYAEINFGRTEVEHAGLRRFKNSWGSREEALPYYYYPEGAAGSWSTGNLPPGQVLMALFAKFAPSWALRAASAAIYKRAA